MYGMNEHFEFTGFDPSSVFVTDSDGALGWLMHLAPKHALVLASIQKVSGTFTCSIDITTHDGSFRGEASDELPQDAMGRAVERAKANIDHWQERQPRELTGA